MPSTTVTLQGSFALTYRQAVAMLDALERGIRDMIHEDDAVRNKQREKAAKDALDKFRTSDCLFI